MDQRNHLIARRRDSARGERCKSTDAAGTAATLMKRSWRIGRTRAQAIRPGWVE
jgi:hypothetical protein